VLQPALRDRVIEAIWPSPSNSALSVWAILDCARDDRIYPALRTSQLDYLSLYSGRLHPAVEAAAPHLIELAPTYRFTPKLIEMGWGQSWGVFVRTEDGANLRGHLRKFLRVQDHTGRTLIFRYYDPRVLRVFLPTCQPEELSTFFGPIHSYLVESGDGGRSLIEYRFDGLRLTQRQVVLGDAGESLPV
jgi:hypothetical protein